VRNRLVALAVTIPAAALLSACGSSSTTGTTTEKPVPPSTAPALPPRPQEVDLTGVDACTLLTSEQQLQLGVDVRPEYSDDPDRYGNRRCHYDKILSNPRFGYSIKVVTQEDATVYLSGKRDVTAKVVSAAGFPAVQYRSPGDDRGCFVAVATKELQYVNVQYGESTGSNDSTEVACEKARVAAEMATQTLLTQR
jgi:hypothetical protein